MAHVIAEHAADPPLSPEAVAAMVDKLRKCLIVREIETIAVYPAANGKRVVMVFRARDAESVRNAFRSADVAFERIWNAADFTVVS